MKEKLFSTNSNKTLAKKVAIRANLSLGKLDIKKFADQEILVFIKESVKNKNVYVFGSSFPPSDNLVELLILINTLKVNGAKKINVIIPYFGYAKADHVYPQGASLAGKLMVNVLELAGASKIIAINLHSRRIENFFKKPLIHLSAIPLLASYFKKIRIKDLTIASPDLGGIARAREFAENLRVKDIITIKKYRPGFDKTEIKKIMGEAKNKNIIIVDDMAQTGRTLIKAARALKKQGAKNIYIAITHLIFSGPSMQALQREKSIKKVIITDSNPTSAKLPFKFKQLSVADLIAKNIKSF